MDYLWSTRNLFDIFYNKVLKTKHFNNKFKFCPILLKKKKKRKKH